VAELRATPRNPWWGLPADALAKVKELGALMAQSSSPFVGPLGTIAEMAVGDAPQALDKLSYGERVTTGQGETLRPDPALLDVAGLFSGIGAAKIASIISKTGKVPEILGPAIRFKDQIYAGGPTHGSILNRMRQEGVVDWTKEKPSYADTRLWRLDTGDVVGEEEAMLLANGKRTEDMAGPAGEAAREHERRIRGR
jgi:hypothetical protein